MNNVKFWIGEHMTIDSPAAKQIKDISELPILAGHLAIMPDVHMGKGATVGSVIPTRSAVIPAAVGVDIGCGMCAVMTNLTANDLPDSLATVRDNIESVIPVGVAEHITENDNMSIPLLNKFKDLLIAERLGHANLGKIARQVGTLGGDNHFIEICLDSESRVWIMLHSGSRNIGSQIGSCAINMAKEQALTRDYKLPDKDLAWLDEGSLEFNIYIEAMRWAQDYAALNRDSMMQAVIRVMKNDFPHMEAVGEVINCHHNFTSLESHFGEDVWVTRKGAVSAKAGQVGIIPGSMGAKSFIVNGKGNPDSYCSCSHGAGRKHSRSEAKKFFSIDDLKLQTAGVECRKDDSVLDEIPAAYKNIDEVMQAQVDLVDIVHTLKQVLCVKG